MTDEEIAVALAEHGKEIGSLKHRMNDVEKIVNVVHQLAEEMVGLTKEIKYMNTSLASLTAKVSQLEGKPAKRWEQVVTALIGAAAGAFITFLLTGGQ